MILSLRHFKLFLSWKEAANLLKRLWWDDVIACRHGRGLGRNFHLCKAVTVCGDHSHMLRPDFPKDTVQNRPTLFSRRCKCRMRYEFLQVCGWNPEALVKLHCRETRELALRQPEELEFRPAALKGDAVIACGRDLYRRWRKFARNFRELSRRNRNSARGLYVCRYLRAYRDVEVGPGNTNAFLGRLNEKVRQNRQRCL